MIWKVAVGVAGLVALIVVLVVALADRRRPDDPGQLAEPEPPPGPIINDGMMKPTKELMKV
jgi:hypothetical protein